MRIYHYILYIMKEFGNVPWSSEDKLRKPLFTLAFLAPVTAVSLGQWEAMTGQGLANQRPGHNYHCFYSRIMNQRYEPQVRVGCIDVGTVRDVKAWRADNIRNPSLEAFHKLIIKPSIGRTNALLIQASNFLDSFFWGLYYSLLGYKNRSRARIFSVNEL